MVDSVYSNLRSDGYDLKNQDDVDALDEDLRETLIAQGATTMLTPLFMNLVTKFSDKLKEE